MGSSSSSSEWTDRAEAGRYPGLRLTLWVTLDTAAVHLDLSGLTAKKTHKRLRCNYVYDQYEQYVEMRADSETTKRRETTGTCCDLSCDSL